MARLTKALILALMLIAALVFVGQVLRLKWIWIGVSLYWAVLTLKNYMDWRKCK